MRQLILLLKIQKNKSKKKKIKTIKDNHENLQKEIDKNTDNKKIGRQDWSDFKFARWDAKRHLLKEQMKWLKELRHDIELADIEHDMAIEGTGGF